jgi:signal peptide peptidase SppA
MAETLKYSRIRSAIAETPWAILPGKLSDIMEFIAFKAQGGELTAEEVRERLGAASTQRAQSSGDVAVLPILGTIAHRAGLLQEASGGTSVQSLTAQFRALVRDPSVSAIVFDVDSPGGAVAGIEEFATEVYRARGTKPIVAVANTVMASAAYWIGTAADEVVATPSALVGSIGVIGAHEDLSASYEKLGVKVSLISAGKYKAENNPFEPLTDEGRAHLQSRVDESYTRFTRAVARHRSVPIDNVRNGYGEGRVLSSRDALEAGMVDRIATIDEVIRTIPRRRETADASAIAGLGADLSYAEYLDLVAGQVSKAVERTRERHVFRSVDGRGVGEPNRARLLQIASDLQAILDDTDPAREERASETRQVYAELRSRLIDAALVAALPD